MASLRYIVKRRNGFSDSQICRNLPLNCRENKSLWKAAGKSKDPTGKDQNLKETKNELFKQYIFSVTKSSTSDVGELLTSAVLAVLT